MYRVPHQLALALALAAGLALPATAATHADPGGRSWALLEEYCNSCHNTVDWAGSVAFDLLTPEGVPDEAKVWESTIRKLQGRLMPPPGEKQPSQQRIDELVAWLQTSLDAAAAARPHSGAVGVQRLTRTEYANSVRGLLGVEIDPKALFPAENEVDGFENVAAALSVSPYFVDQYLGAARTVARMAVGDVAPKVTTAFHAAPGGEQDRHEPGLPLGTRGGMKFRHHFPADGDYRLNVMDLDIGLYPWAVETRHTLVVLLDGREVFRGDIGGREDLATIDREGADGRRKLMSRFQGIPLQVPAGPHELVVSFVERAQAESDEVVGGGGGFGGPGEGYGRLRVPRLLDGIQILGPVGNARLTATPSRRQVFVCEPQAAAEEPDCARQIARHLAGRFFRRPAQDADVARLMDFYATGRRNGGSFDHGIRQLLTAVLAHPDFLYRALPPQPGQAVRTLTDHELATRLAFFLWSATPDDTLLQLAQEGRLHEPAVLRAQTLRLLRDPRATALVDGFAMRWLNLDELESVEPDPALFPVFRPELRQDFSTELRLFLREVLLADRSVLELVSADYSFLNERLARHYGLEGVSGPQFRRVQLRDSHRFGLLGKGAMLLRTSYGDRTSPILRGAWVLDKLMGTPPAPPPPGVNTDLSTPVGQKPKTLRARLEVHRKTQACNQCHGVIDPIGLALDSFDAIGRWRSIDTVAQEVIDADTVLANGVAVKGVDGLRAEILSQPDKFALALGRKLMVYALGRELDPADMPTLRGILRSAQPEGYRLSSLVLGIVNSPAFLQQGTVAAPEPLKVAR
ncbi:MAG: hypothetical protein RL026_1450 [Pseudomonadota bacterium]